jgi:hypothetical protein
MSPDPFDFSQGMVEAVGFVGARRSRPADIVPAAWWTIKGTSPAPFDFLVERHQAKWPN